MQLELLVKDSKRQETQAQKHVYTLTKSECVAYIGPTASSPAKMVSIMTSVPPKDRAVISYSATSTELSEPRFANFLRTPPADDVRAEIMASFMVDGNFRVQDDWSAIITYLNTLEVLVALCYQSPFLVYMCWLNQVS